MSGFCIKLEMTAKCMRLRQKRNFENRFINRKVNADYVGEEEEVRLNWAYLGLLASTTGDRPKINFAYVKIEGVDHILPEQRGVHPCRLLFLSYLDCVMSIVKASSPYDVSTR